MASFLAVSTAQAATVIGPWVPIFKGIDHAVGTNTPGGGGIAELQVVQAIRVDLTDADIRFLSTPRYKNDVPDSQETGGLTVSDFMITNKVQLAINADFFNPQDYYLPAETPMDVLGLQISQGVVVSSQDSSDYSATIMFTTNNQPTIFTTNWPPHSTAAAFTRRLPGPIPCSAIMSTLVTNTPTPPT